MIAATSRKTEARTHFWNISTALSVFSYFTVQLAPKFLYVNHLFSVNNKLFLPSPRMAQLMQVIPQTYPCPFRMPIGYW